jgi:hypothetical protein
MEPEKYYYKIESVSGFIPVMIDYGVTDGAGFNRLKVDAAPLLKVTRLDN